MRMYDIIIKKRNEGSLSKEEVEFFVDSFTKGEIPDYQAAAFLMAAFIRGMDHKETLFLTQAMRGTGENLDLSSISGPKVDKHSTGGVGDGTSLILAPLIASFGVVVPMISGRGLAHTGGTLDKLEAIPNFRVGLTKEEFFSQLKKIGVAMIGQTEKIAPADKKIYALRDVTATVDSIPLITASILSKKLAEGCDGLVLDVKTGDGAFMQEKKNAVKLAKTMVEIGKRSNKKMVALVTNMAQPLGAKIGNALEISQAIEILQGKESQGTKDIIELVDFLGGWMLFLAGVAKNHKEGKEKVSLARKNGQGFAKFKEMVSLQGGDPKVCEDPSSILPQPKKTKEILSPWKGRVYSLNARLVGTASLLLGAGRNKQEDSIDPSAGTFLHKKIGDSVEKGEALAEFYYNSDNNLDAATKTFFAGIKISKLKPKPFKLVYEVIR